MKAISSSAPRLPSASLTAAILILSCLFGTLLAASANDAPLTRETLQSLYSQHKITADQLKILQTDLTNVSGAQKNLESFKTSLTADQVKLAANQAKQKALQQQIMVAQQQLLADQTKFLPKSSLVPDPGKIRADDESPKERRSR